MQETQDELTSELLDLKEKYREVVSLLRDANEEIRRGRKRGYPGAGQHAVASMFPAPSHAPAQHTGELCALELQTIHRFSQTRSRLDLDNHFR